MEGFGDGHQSGLAAHPATESGEFVGLFQPAPVARVGVQIHQDLVHAAEFRVQHALDLGIGDGNAGLGGLCGDLGGGGAGVVLWGRQWPVAGQGRGQIIGGLRWPVGAGPAGAIGLPLCVNLAVPQRLEEGGPACINAGRIGGMAGSKLIDVIGVCAIHEGLGVELVVGGVVGHYCLRPMSIGRLVACFAVLSMDFDLL